MTSLVSRLPFSLDPLIAEAKRRMRRRRLLIAAALLVAVAAGGSTVATHSPGGPGSAGPSGGHGVLSAPGRVGEVRIDLAGAIGPLQVNRSGRAQVITYAGRPSLDLRGRYDTKYEVLGYGCAQGAGTEKYWSSCAVPCETAFYLVGGKLSLFFSHDRRFAEAAGVQIGTPTKGAAGSRRDRLRLSRTHAGA